MRITGAIVRPLPSDPSFRIFYACPVCHHIGLRQDPVVNYSTHEICPGCGTQFGYDDICLTHGQLREAWINAGRPWWAEGIELHAKPDNWPPK